MVWVFFRSEIHKRNKRSKGVCAVCFYNKILWFFCVFLIKFSSWSIKQISHGFYYYQDIKRGGSNGANTQIFIFILSQILMDFFFFRFFMKFSACFFQTDLTYRFYCSWDTRCQKRPTPKRITFFIISPDPKGHVRYCRRLASVIVVCLQHQ